MYSTLLVLSEDKIIGLHPENLHTCCQNHCHQQPLYWFRRFSHHLLIQTTDRGRVSGWMVRCCSHLIHVQLRTSIVRPRERLPPSPCPFEPLTSPTASVRSATIRLIRTRATSPATFAALHRSGRLTTSTTTIHRANFSASSSSGCECETWIEDRTSLVHNQINSHSTRDVIGESW